MALFLTAIVVAAILFFSWRADDLFVLAVRDGRTILVRGRIPRALKEDFADALTRQGIRKATIRAYRDRDGARLDVSGIDEFAAQRLRNIFRLYPVSLLAAAPRDERRTIGQVLGIAWLAWLLDRNG